MPSEVYNAIFTHASNRERRERRERRAGRERVLIRRRGEVQRVEKDGT